MFTSTTFNKGLKYLCYVKKLNVDGMLVEQQTGMKDARPGADFVWNGCAG